MTNVFAPLPGTVHVPAPAAARFEKQLGALLAQRACDGCARQLGSAPRTMWRCRQYHPACYDKYIGLRTTSVQQTAR